MASAQQPKQTPPLRVNILNVCSPSEEEQKEITTALGRIPRQNKFSMDYEVARGHTAVEGPGSDWIRIRRDFGADSAWTAAQFLYSTSSAGVREVVVLFSREAKGVTQVALEDRVTTPAAAATVLAANTPVSRISLERFEKPHLVLARCPDVNQAALEPLFRTASDIMTLYRGRLDARQIVPGELGRLRVPAEGNRSAPRRPTRQP